MENLIPTEWDLALRYVSFITSGFVVVLSLSVAWFLRRVRPFAGALLFLAVNETITSLISIFNLTDPGRSATIQERRFFLIFGDVGLAAFLALFLLAMMRSAQAERST